MPNGTGTNRLWIAAALLLASAATASARDALIDSNLNLRAGPALTQRIVVVIPAGATVNVGECGGEWCRIEYRGQKGYVSSALVKGGDAAYAAAPPAPAVATKYNPHDSVTVHNWNDHEWRDRYWREMGARRPSR